MEANAISLTAPVHSVPQRARRSFVLNAIRHNWPYLIGGLALTGYGIRRKGRAGFGLALSGAGIAFRALRQVPDANRFTALAQDAPSGTTRCDRSITIARPREWLFQYLKENYARFGESLDL